MAKQNNPRRSDPGGSQATLTSTVYEELRRDILEGRLPPGERLRIDALCERYQVGASPVREALNRLAATHLVEQVDQRGFRVPAVSLEEFDELARTRRWVNDVAVRESIRNGDAAWEDAVALAFHRMWRTPVVLPDGHLNREWEAWHRRFHAAAIAACPSHWLRQFHETLFDCSDRYRNIYAMGAAHRGDDPVEAHRQIMEAVVRRDADLAVKLLNDGIEALRPAVQEALGQRPDSFQASPDGTSSSPAFAERLGHAQPAESSQVRKRRIASASRSSM